jgi:peptidoglycan hydrolase-like protein with peptidoglycan-binding domain
MQQRLQNLGYQCETTGETADDSVEALKLFQQDHDLEVTGRFDERTRSALEDAHGS